ncbi:ribosomal protein L1p/L10e family-domain-containing protein [Bisporella sp. PMI_857]|nr:ribosomal protein L1p/L10e family-domain-containing protein [Bisporella sp. PMI_857]
MAPKSTALTTKVDNGSPYQLNSEQIQIASRSLLKHLGEEAPAPEEGAKRNLLDDDDDNSDALPIWLTLTTKKHITDTKRLKPGKIEVPHPINTSKSSSILLITADPQRTYKDIVASPAFPAELSQRVARVIGLSKLKLKFKTYEAQRKLRSEYDIILADDRIITQLPKVLGKTFYGTTKHRPIPVNLAAARERDADGKTIKAAPVGPGVKPPKGTPQAGTAKAISSEIQSSLAATLVYLSPSTCTSVKVGYHNWDPTHVAQNIEAVATALIEKYVPKQWRGVRGVHVKGASTMALPIWLADELWVDEGDVLDEEQVKVVEEANISKKRKRKLLSEAANGETLALENGDVEGKKKKRKAPVADSLGDEVAAENKKDKKAKKTKLAESNDDRLDAEIAARKAMLKKQKEEAALPAGDEVPISTKTKERKEKKKNKAISS